MPGHWFSLPARRQEPLFEHSLYCATVTSSSSRQYGESFTRCGGFSKGNASFSSEPMKYSPPGMKIMPVGHFGGATAGADDGGGGVALAMGFVACAARHAKNPPPASASIAMPAPTKI